MGCHRVIPDVCGHQDLTSRCKYLGKLLKPATTTAAKYYQNNISSECWRNYCIEEPYAVMCSTEFTSMQLWSFYLRLKLWLTADSIFQPGLRQSIMKEVMPLRSLGYIVRDTNWHGLFPYKKLWGMCWKLTDVKGSDTNTESLVKISICAISLASCVQKWVQCLFQKYIWFSLLFDYYGVASIY